MRLSPDELIFWQWGVVKLNATLLFSWVVMLVLVIAAVVMTRSLSSSTEIKRGQATLEVILDFLLTQIEDVSQQPPLKYLAFIATLFLYIFVANVLTIVPWYEAPTGSLSTTAALAFCVFIAVPFFAIRAKGWQAYLRQYIEPSFIMMPFNLISEVSRTLSLAIRLFGNIMSGNVIVAILVGIAPLFLPIVMQAFGLLIGVIQAYIFSILAVVFIASATVESTPEKQDLKVENT